MVEKIELEQFESVKNEQRISTLIGSIKVLCQGRNFDKNITWLIKKIIESENEFIYGFSETMSYGLDMAFRYLFAGSYVLYLASVYMFQRKNHIGFSYLAGSIVLTALILITMFAQIVTYRKRRGGYDAKYTLKFYFKCLCFKTKQNLENYE